VREQSQISRRRQWGSDRRTDPLPIIAAAPTDRSLTLGRVSIVVTVLAWAAYVVSTVIRQYVDHGVQGMRFVSETASYVLVVTFLTYSSLMYLVARQGAMYRTRAHRRVPRAVVDEFFESSLPTMTVLVPSYREDPRVVRMTLISAALQEYPYLRVVLLIDDPPSPTERVHQEALAQARALPAQLADWLHEPATRFEAALESVEARAIGDEDPGAADVLVLAEEYAWASKWLHDASVAETVVDHVDRFFADEVLEALAADLAATGSALRAAAGAERGAVSRARLLQLYRRLAWTFRAELTSFERKRFVSLSDEANKAMNLNSYLGLMGGRFETEETPDGTVLHRVRGSGSLDVPDSDYVLTLDADSILLREYCLRLVYFLEQPHNDRIAVAQTPYSAFPGAGTRLERLAGATTDLQHIVHQGMTFYGATFWVGANAVLRKRALEDIVEVEREGGREVRRYIQDRTVIEDTESSVDLGVHGWGLVNYPERLSYSATPPDFGALCIQRRRWANGGLLILPKLWRYVRERRRRFERGRVTETLLRINYMASTAWASAGLVLLLAYPYDSRLLSPLVLVAAMPYVLAMASDLKSCGYKRLDVVRIYGFNLILLPVNLAGVLKSVQQSVTGRKIPFARTSKVRNRTATPPLFILAPVAIVGFSGFTFWRDTLVGNWGNAAFAAANATLATYALVAFVGLRNSVVDLWLGLLARLYVPADRPDPVPRRRRRRVMPAPVPAQSWRSVLYHGPRLSPELMAPAPAVGDPAPAPVRLPDEPTPSGRSIAWLPHLLDSLGHDADVAIGLDAGEIVVRLRPGPPAP
jgi:cellulose synthase/poly-beta-1,6-N-acetylglucosamine synthase-like glycosyltransferase